MYTDLTEQVRPHDIGDAWQVMVSKEERKQLEKKTSKEMYWKVKDQTGVWTFREMKDAMLMSKIVNLEQKVMEMIELYKMIMQNAEVKLSEKPKGKKDNPTS